MTTPAFDLSPAAAERVAAILADQKRGFLRVAVNGGGCSGFSYAFDFDDAAGTDDRIFERAGAKVLVDETSLELLAGSVLDYVDELIGASFQIRNPNAVASCGCGTSFSV